MFYVYLLQDINQKLYTGYSSDLRKRMSQHYAGKTITTSRMQKPKLIYYEAYLDKKLAQDRERKLKHLGSAYYALLKRLKIK